MRGWGGISNARNSTNPRRPVGTVRGIEFVDADLGTVGVAGDVDQQVAEDPVDQPGRAIQAGRGERVGDLPQRDLQLIKLIVARFIHARRLAGRADEQAAEQVAERGMVLPIPDQRGEQVRAAQERAVGRGRAADDDMVAAAGPGRPAVDHVFGRIEQALPRLFVERLGDVGLFAPGMRRLDVDLDHPGIRGHLDHAEPRVRWRRIPLHMDRRGDSRPPLPRSPEPDRHTRRPTPRAAGTPSRCRHAAPR